MKLKQIVALVTAGLSLVMVGCEYRTIDRCDVIVFGESEEMTTRTQLVYEGVKQYADLNGLKVEYHVPKDSSVEGIGKEFRTLANKQAKYYFFADESFAEAIYEHQASFNTSGLINFACIGFLPTSLDGAVTWCNPNTLGVSFNDEETGYVCAKIVTAEYSSFGFVQNEKSELFQKGFEKGVAECGGTLVVGSCEEVKTWYESGVDVVFAPEDTIYDVAPVANEMGKKVIGTGLDRSALGESVLFSAVPDYKLTAYSMLKVGRIGLAHWTYRPKALVQIGLIGVKPILSLKTQFTGNLPQLDYVYYTVPERLKSVYEETYNALPSKYMNEYVNELKEL